MFAIVTLSGQQYKIDDATQELRVQYLADKNIGDAVAFDNVLHSDGKSNIKATVARHDRDETIIVFKKKRRKGYRRTNGHRQKFTVLNVSIA